MYEDIKEQYNQLLNSKKALSEDEVLNILIKIENSIKHNFLRNLPNSGTGYSMDEVRELIEIFKNENPNQKRKIIEDAERETLYGMIGVRASISEIIDEYHNKIKQVISESDSIEQTLSSLGIPVRYINSTILPPEGDTIIQRGSGTGVKEKAGYDRTNLLFDEILNLENNIYPGDIDVIIGKNSNSSLRKYSYIVIKIKKLNKTIFVNNTYGQATYIYNGIPTDEDISIKGKQSFKDKCIRIVFHNTYQRKKQVLDALFKENNSNENNPNKDNPKKDRNNKIESNLTKQEKIRNILSQNEYKQKRFSLNFEERKTFKLHDGTSYYDIAKIFGFIRKNEYSCKDVAFIEISKRIFGENDPDITNYIIGKKQQITNILNKKKNKEERFSSDSEERKKYKLPDDGTSYYDIAKIFGATGDKDNLLINATFIEISKRIFGENDPMVVNYINDRAYANHTEKSIKDLFTENPELEKERFKLIYFIQRRDYKLPDGTSYIMIARIFGFKEEKDQLFKDEFFIKLSKRIFGKNNPDVKQLSKQPKKVIEELFKKNPELKEKRFSLNHHERQKFTLDDGTKDGISYVRIARTFGITLIQNDLYKEETFIELSKRIFGEEDPMVVNHIKEHKNHTEQSIIDLFKNNPELKEKRFSLNHNKRKNFTLDDGTRDGISYVRIARTFKITEELKDLFKDEVFIELSKRIFGEEDPMVVNYINSHAYLYHTKQSIIDLFKNNPELKKERFSLNHAGRKKFKLKDGTKYYHIAKILGVIGNKEYLCKTTTFIEISKIIFGENDPDIKNL